MIRLLHLFTPVFLSFLLLACSGSQPGPANLPEQQVDVLVLGGSVAALSAASAIRDFDENISVLLVASEAKWVTEPYINLYLLDKIDEGLVVDSYEKIAQNKHYRFLQEEVRSLDADVHQAVFSREIVRYRKLIDLRYVKNSAGINHSPESLVQIKHAIADTKNRNIIIDAGDSNDDIVSRAMELTYLLRQKYRGNSDHSVQLVLHRVENDEEVLSTKADLYIKFPSRSESNGIIFGSNFFAQYNLGQESVVPVIKELFGASYFPNLVEEKAVMLTDYATLSAVDVNGGETVDGSAYLAKIKKIKQELIEGR